jgi:hypothetical protein
MLHGRISSPTNCKHFPDELTAPENIEHCRKYGHAVCRRTCAASAMAGSSDGQSLRNDTSSAHCQAKQGTINQQQQLPRKGNSQTG